MRFVDIGGARLEVVEHEARTDGAPVLVFLHEGLGCAAMWRGFPQTIAATTGCAAIVYSRAGYGRSSPAAPETRGVHTMRDEATRVLPALLDALAIRRAVLVGHSDGASIALIHAGMRAARDRIAAVVALAPHVVVETLTIESIRRARDAYVDGDLRPKLARWHGENVDDAFWGWNRMWLDPAFRAWRIVDDVASIRAPILAIQGEDDEYGTTAQLDLIASHARGRVDRVIFDRCGHSPHRDRPTETAAAIVELIDDVMATS
jgi:pimeloyl-ACP methyl ester carboxylesterase